MIYKTHKARETSRNVVRDRGGGCKRKKERGREEERLVTSRFHYGDASLRQTLRFNHRLVQRATRYFIFICPRFDNSWNFQCSKGWRERERDKVGFLLLPRRWKVAGFNTFPIAKLIYINIQSREWCIYQASIERSEKLRVIRNSISMSHEVYTYTYCSLHHVGTVVVIGFLCRSRASIVETRSLQTHTYIA